MSTEKDRIYLDYNATTPLEDEVLDEIHSRLRDAWGNPSSSYQAGVKAKAVIQEARKNLALMLGASDSALTYYKDIQSSNTGIGQKNSLPHFVTSNLEHDSIKLVLEHFEKNGLAEVTYVKARASTGRVEVNDIVGSIRDSTVMVTVMLANNETGVLQPISEISENVQLVNKERPTRRVLLHSDAAQAIGKIQVDVKDLQVDYLTVVGHKFYAPRIGALYVRGLSTLTPLYPMFFGGGQERNYRPGTENTGMIAGLGKAAELVVKFLPTYENHMRKVRDYLEEKLKEVFQDRVHINGKYSESERLPNTCNMSVIGKGLQGNRILEQCHHIQASVGAACHSGGNHKASSILLAIGVPEEIAVNAVRLSVGRSTTLEDINLVVNDLLQAVAKLESEH